MKTNNNNKIKKGSFCCCITFVFVTNSISFALIWFTVIDIFLYPYLGSVDSKLASTIDADALVALVILTIVATLLSIISLSISLLCFYKISKTAPRKWISLTAFFLSAFAFLLCAHRFWELLQLDRQIQNSAM